MPPRAHARTRAVPCGGGSSSLPHPSHPPLLRTCSHLAVAQPGYGWAAGDASDVCPQGYYNPGYNTRDCTKCPGGLTTVSTTSTSTAQCKAPAGFYYLRGRAIACAQGTYKTAIANADCDECAAGLTTTFGEVGKTAAADCAGEPTGLGLGQPRRWCSGLGPGLGPGRALSLGSTHADRQTACRGRHESGLPLLDPKAAPSDKPTPPPPPPTRLAQ
jgi:hypothetical protein